MDVYLLLLQVVGLHPLVEGLDLHMGLGAMEQRLHLLEALVDLPVLPGVLSQRVVHDHLHQPEPVGFPLLVRPLLVPLLRPLPGGLADGGSGLGGGGADLGVVLQVVLVEHLVEDGLVDELGVFVPLHDLL